MLFRKARSGTIVPKDGLGSMVNTGTTERSVSIHDDHHTPSRASAPGSKHIDVDGIANLADDFDQIAVVVDWLDACRNRDLAALLDLYAEDATLECRCGEVKLREGRAELESYWRPRLDALAPTAFGLEEVTPTTEGVVLDYLSYEGKPVRIAFTFAPDGKIRLSACAPAPPPLHSEIADVANEAG
jgi:ketosteroid isomerase-like protein